MCECTSPEKEKKMQKNSLGKPQDNRGMGLLSQSLGIKIQIGVNHSSNRRSVLYLYEGCEFLILHLNLFNFAFLLSPFLVFPVQMKHLSSLGAPRGAGW